MKPKIDEYWIARVKYWPADDFHVIPIQIYYIWKNGAIDFTVFAGDNEVIRSSQCAHFELLEKIGVDKYK